MFDDLRVGPRWDVSPADLRIVAQAYGWRIPDQVITPLGGAVNGVVRIETPGGDVVIRVHRPWTTPRRLEAVHAVQDQLRNLRPPIPRIYPAKDGRT